NDQQVVWKKIVTERKQSITNEFYVLTNKQWLQWTDNEDSLTMFLLTVMPTKNGCFSIPLDDVRLLFTEQRSRKKFFTGICLTDYSDILEGVPPVLGVESTREEYDQLLNAFKSLISWENPMPDKRDKNRSWYQRKD
ncbi:MAG TPA: hypothetical protein VKK79_25145, partial [Candidatus Lokiarchaeia archaeon]|nr:hypothetical protein [Candidatus Lokiarchaeia archaeon]